MTNHSLDSILYDFAFARELFAAAEKALLDTGATGIAIALKEDASFVCRATAGTTVPTLGIHIDEAVGLTGTCIRSGKTEICVDAAVDRRVNAEACEQLQIASIIVVPILDAGQTVGIVEALWSAPYAFGSEASLVLQDLADQIRRDEFGRFSLAKKTPAQDQTFERKTLAWSELKSGEDIAPHFGAETVESTEAPFTAAVEPASGSKIILVPLLVLGVMAATITIAVTHFPFSKRQQIAPAPAIVSPPTPTPTFPVASLPSMKERSASELEFAALAGDPGSQLQLATALAQGKGIRQDLVSAYAWYILANTAGQEDPSNLLPSLSQRLSEKQIAEVRMKLGDMFWKGTGIKPDRVAAYTWLSLADAAGSPEAAASLDRLAAEMTPLQIEEAKQRAQTWLLQHHQSAGRR